MKKYLKYFIFEIPLAKDYGFAYALAKQVGDYCWHFRPIDFWSRVSLKKAKELPNSILTLQPLCGDLIFLNAFPQRKGWTILKELPDLNVDMSFFRDTNDIYHFINCKGSYSYEYIYDYTNIAHLSNSWGSVTVEALSERLTIYWVKKNNEDYHNFFTQEELSKNFWRKHYIKDADNLIFYSEVEPRYWNKPKYLDWDSYLVHYNKGYP